MPTRVLICGMPRLLMDVVAAILAQAPGVVVVAQLDGAADVTTVVSTLQPDVVVLEESEVPGLGSHAALFAARESLRVVAVSGTGGDGVLYRMGARPVHMPRLSAAKLVRAVRRTRIPQPVRSRRISGR